MSVSHIYLSDLTRHIQAGSTPNAHVSRICGTSLFPYNIKGVQGWKPLGAHSVMGFMAKHNDHETNLTAFFHKDTPWWPTRVETTQASHHDLMKNFQDLEENTQHTPFGIAKHQFYFSESHASVNQPCFLRVNTIQDEQIVLQSFKGHKFVHNGQQKLVPHLLNPQERLILNFDDIEPVENITQAFCFTAHSMRQAHWKRVTHPPLERT